jgi:hypothetical protein
MAPRFHLSRFGWQFKPIVAVGLNPNGEAIWYSKLSVKLVRPIYFNIETPARRRVIALTKSCLPAPKNSALFTSCAENASLLRKF